MFCGLTLVRRNHPVMKDKSEQVHECTMRRAKAQNTKIRTILIPMDVSLHGMTTSANSILYSR
jgi:hypothetical protein